MTYQWGRGFRQIRVYRGSPGSVRDLAAEDSNSKGEGEIGA